MNASLLSVTILSATLSACGLVGPDYQGPPKVGHDPRFLGSRGQPVQLDQWWRLLGSGELNGLVDRARRNNYDIAIAGQRLREARAQRKQVASSILPRAEASASYTSTSTASFGLGGIAAAGFLDSPLKYWSAGLDVSWEIDVFGGGRRKTRGARAREQAALESLHATQLAIASEVTETYFTIAGMREQLAKVNAQVKLQQAQTNDTRQRVSAGASSRLDLDRARARLAMTEAKVPPLEAGVTTQLRRLALLLGERPGALDSRRIAAGSLPRKLPMVRTGLPADLIMRRPDLRMAERELAAATEDIGVAVSHFYPKFTIAGGPSNISASPGDLFRASNFFWQYTPQVRWSLFTAGSNRAMLEAANARQKSALLNYQKSVLAAIGEVETQLTHLRAETRKLAIVQRARAATAATVRRVRENHEAGAIDYAEVLIEEERLRDVEITEIRVKNQMLQLWIRLHKALGGGWK